MSQRHERQVIEIAAKVAGFYKVKKPFRVYHGSTKSTRILQFKKSEMVDVSQLNNVLSIDIKNKTAIVEPNVAMDKLAKSTLKYGLIPPIVMEFPGITVGGGIQGNGGESSSFKWGTFNQTFNWFELILANGTKIKASPTENADLYYGVPGTAGTISLITAAEVNLLPAKKYVELTNIPIDSFEHAKQVIEESITKNVDFVDGIMFSKTSGVIVVGKMSDTTMYAVERFSRARDQWYYLHVEGKRREHQAIWKESVPLVDYLFRYDRGAFWVGRFAFEMFGVPYTRFMRWLLNPMLHTRKLYQALQESGASQQHLVQDLVLPAKNATKFLEFTDIELSTYPLWLCPMKPDLRSSFQLNNIRAPLIINVGVWGNSIPGSDEFIRLNRLVEKQVLAMNGKKWSYAHSYFTNDEFWGMYDKAKYDALRKKYSATHLSTMYDKLTVTTKVPIQRKKAVIKTLFGLAKLSIKD